MGVESRSGVPKPRSSANAFCLHPNLSRIGNVNAHKLSNNMPAYSGFPSHLPFTNETIGYWTKPNTALDVNMTPLILPRVAKPNTCALKVDIAAYRNALKHAKKKKLASCTYRFGMSTVVP